MVVTIDVIMIDGRREKQFFCWVWSVEFYVSYTSSAHFKNMFLCLCSVHDDFKSVIKECYAPYSQGVEDTEPFGLMNGSA